MTEHINGLSMLTPAVLLNSHAVTWSRKRARQHGNAPVDATSGSIHPEGSQPVMSFLSLSRANMARSVMAKNALQRPTRKKRMRKTSEVGKGDDDAQPLKFSVRCMDLRKGLGMFAEEDICAGDIIVAERPLVSACPRLKEVTCLACCTPLHDLRRHLSAQASSSLDNLRLPGIDLSNGPKYGARSVTTPEPRTASETASTRCDGCGFSWCSLACLESNYVVHRLLQCCGGVASPSPAQKLCLQFRTHALLHEERNLILAGDAIAAIVAKFVVAASDTKGDEVKVSKVIQSLINLNITYNTTGLNTGMLWWREFMHTKWWLHDVDDEAPEKERRRRRLLCKESAALMTSALLATSEDAIRKALAKHSDSTNASTNTSIEGYVKRLIEPIHAIIKGVLVTTETVGEIMGMFASNAMEIEIRSPCSDYFELLPEWFRCWRKHTSKSEEDNQDNDEHCGTALGGSAEAEAWKTLKDLLPSLFLSVNKSNSKSSGNSTTPEPEIMPETLESLSDLIPGLVGTGLFPLLTLANHDCNPNASIEFLGECSKASMVARRHIQKGDEITITYVPAGNDDASDDDSDARDSDANNGTSHDSAEASNRFKHFKPTRTWDYFSKLEVWDDDDDADDDDDDDDGSDNDDDSGNDHDHDDNDGGEDGESTCLEGSTWQERERMLRPYGFICHCTRCSTEREREVDGGMREDQ